VCVLYSYAKFCSLLRLQTERPTKRSVVWVTRRIEEIYKDRADRWLLAQSVRVSLENIFPVFCFEHFKKCFGLSKLVDVICWDFVYSLHAFRQSSRSIEVFARFLEEAYSNDDLHFYVQMLEVARSLPSTKLTSREANAFAHIALGGGPLHARFSGFFFFLSLHSSVFSLVLTLFCIPFISRHDFARIRDQQYRPE